MIDHTRTKELKERLKQRPEDYRAIIDDADMPISITDAKGNYVAINHAYTKIYHLKEKEVVGKSFLMVVPEEFHEYMQQAHDQFFVDKYENLRDWSLDTGDGYQTKFMIDALYEDRLPMGPVKYTFLVILDRKKI